MNELTERTFIHQERIKTGLIERIIKDMIRWNITLEDLQSAQTHTKSDMERLQEIREVQKNKAQHAEHLKKLHEGQRKAREEKKNVNGK